MPIIALRNRGKLKNGERKTIKHAVQWGGEEKGVPLAQRKLLLKMKNINKFILIIFFSLSPTYAIVQTADFLSYDGETYDIYSYPLYIYLKGKDSLRLRGNYAASNNIRGYTASFTIKNGKLFVSEIKVTDYDEDAKKVFERSVFYQVFQQDTLKTADWYSGLIVLPKGKAVQQELSDDCFGSGFYYKYERYILIDIANGIVQSVKEISAEEYKQFRENQYKEYVNSKKYKNRIAKVTDSLYWKGDTIPRRSHPNFMTNDDSWGLSGYIGLNMINYDNKTNSWIPDHGGPCFEIGILYKTFSLNGEIRPWTVNGNSNVVIGNDTLFNYWRFNDIKLNLIFSTEIPLFWKISFNPFVGLSHTALVFLDESAAKHKINIPSTTGCLSGIYLNINSNTSSGINYPLRIGIRYCSEDYSKVISTLGKNYWAMDITIGLAGKL